MAWPPTPLPVNFGNATVSLNTHPQAHNNTNNTINTDIVPEINAIRSDVATLETADVNAANRIQTGVWIGPIIQAGSFASQTFAFNPPFTQPPKITLGWYESQYGLATVDQITTTGFTLYAIPLPGQSTTARVTWCAVGPPI